jgi:hypothetical protein
MLIIRRQRGAFKTTTESERLAGVVACYLLRKFSDMRKKGSIASSNDFFPICSWIYEIVGGPFIQIESSCTGSLRTRMPYLSWFLDHS